MTADDGWGNKRWGAGEQAFPESGAGNSTESTAYLPRVGGDAGQLFTHGGDTATGADSAMGSLMDGAEPETYPVRAGGKDNTSGAAAAPVRERPAQEAAAQDAAGARKQAGPAPASARRAGRGPRRASLQVRRFDPWSVLKLALVLGLAMFFIWLVAVGLLYTVLDGMGVWDRVNGTYASLVAGETADAPVEPLITAGRVFGGAAVIGMINIVLMSALATVSAFIYNVSADLAGGLELTLSERD